MRAAFFHKKSDDTLQFIAYARTKNYRLEFSLLVQGDVSNPHIFNTYGTTPPPTLTSDSVLGVGRNHEEAQTHIVMTGEKIGSTRTVE